MSYTLIVMARHPVMKMILNDSDSDDELEMLTICAIEMNKLNSEESSGVRRGSIQGQSVILRNRVQGHERLDRDYDGIKGERRKGNKREGGREKKLDGNQEAHCGEGDDSLDVAREMKAREIK